MNYFAAFFALAIPSTFTSTPNTGQPATPLELRPGDRIGIIGNTLADRMQHDGWLETFLYARFPKHDLVFRNLGFSGDELKLRLRSADFGSPDHWLKLIKADVVFAFFGYNESFAGQQGLAKFESDLDGFLKQTQKQQVNGQSSPRIVLFSPIAHEDLKSPNLPDGSDNNKRLALYTAAMAKVAKANNVTFVDLFDLSQKLYAQNERPQVQTGKATGANTWSAFGWQQMSGGFAYRVEAIMFYEYRANPNDPWILDYLANTDFQRTFP